MRESILAKAARVSSINHFETSGVKPPKRAIASATASENPAVRTSGGRSQLARRPWRRY